ncbi:hypothetical protein PLANTIT3_60694 [Plantibacter sp. T3]|nr:hypothetical protein PLANTIT3_60694 [Plantibacter sp. T3]
MRESRYAGTEGASLPANLSGPVPHRTGHSGKQRTFVVRSPTVKAVSAAAALVKLSGQ